LIRYLLPLGFAGLLFFQNVLGAAPDGAPTLGTGDAFPPFQAEDQHGQAYTFEPGC